jgi:hypothetical protein
MSRQGMNNMLNELEIKVIDALSIGGTKTSHNIAAISIFWNLKPRKFWTN